MTDWIRKLQQEEKVGWLLNMHASTGQTEDESKLTLATLQMYFLSADGETFSAAVPYCPYFYVVTVDGAEREVEMGLKHQFANTINDVLWVEKEDLDMTNHLSGRCRVFLKVLFNNSTDLNTVKSKLMTAVKTNASREAVDLNGGNPGVAAKESWMQRVLDLREYDMKYHVRCSIDLDIFVGVWYKVSVHHGTTTICRGEDAIAPCPRIFTFDIETTKAPLKFPQPNTDQVFMISMMLDDKGVLLINREIVSSDIEDFEYFPKASDNRVTPVVVKNLANEKETLKEFFALIRSFKPHVVVTYNGDSFDFPFVCARAEKHKIDMKVETGFSLGQDGTYSHQVISHLDCIYWVKRDSYLPQGSHGLKAVTRAKLGYNPVEIDPEEMLPLARTQPQRMASYSVSDSVATFDLFQKYVQPFIFSLCTIIPMSPDEVLRKGSGTLCESLLCIQAYHKNVIYPNKMVEQRERFHKGHLIDTETYIGGHVEALEAGLYRNDIPMQFKCNPSTYQGLIDNLDNALKFALEVENNTKIEDVVNYQEIRDSIATKLADIRDNPNRLEKPMIIHLDVGAMYPNIILTNRLQPPSMVTEDTCAACCFNRPENDCKRYMQWIWKGEMFTATRGEFNQLKAQLEKESFTDLAIKKAEQANENKKSFKFKKPTSLFDQQQKKGGRGFGGKFGRGGRGAGGGYRRGGGAAPTLRNEYKSDSDGSSSEDEAKHFHDLQENTQFGMVKRRVTDYCRKAHRKIHITEEITKTSIVCQRENSFYVDTVRLFRDRRYVYKAETKKWKGNLSKAQAGVEGAPSLKECHSRLVQYESLQLAHKCILNSFYGYVMRKGSRWYSMEMAGVVTYLGATLIQMARELVQNLGIPLELDTDGIWCCLPASFPEEFNFKTQKGKITVSYPCLMLNKDVSDKYTNHQYQIMKSPGVYEKASECSIFFEVDGPHKAMILPASQHEGGCIKKRYAVFYADGSLGELKGFEIKRRGELKLLKDFQDQVFGKFMAGTTLEEAYKAAASVANSALDVLFTKGKYVDDDEILDMLIESRNMSRRLDEYPKEQKSLALTTARRIADFLGPQMVQDRGLNCSFLISKKPEGKPVTVRAIPISIFSADPAVREQFLRRWTGDTSGRLELRDMLDWDYYITRFSSCVQKIITIPAALQGIANPVPRVKHPDWLENSIRAKNSNMVQKKLTFEKLPRALESSDDDDDADVDNTDGLECVRSMGVKTQSNQEIDNTPAVAPPEFQQAYFTRKEFGARDIDDKFFNDSQFPQWFKSAKAKWRSIAQKEKSVIPAGNTEYNADTNPTGDLRWFAQRAQRKILSSVWHVLEVRKASPGTVTLVTLLDGTDVRTFTVHVPRIVFVDSATSLPSTAACVPTNGLVLPRHVQSGNMYALHIPHNEDLKTVVNALRSCSEAIRGVYETHIDETLRFISTMGNRVRVTNACAKERTANTLTSETFSLSDLQQANGDSYLSKWLQLNYVYIYHVAKDGRCLTCVLNSTSRELHVIIVQPTSAPKVKFGLEILGDESQLEQFTQPGSVWLQPTSISVEYFLDKRQSWRRVDELVSDIVALTASVIVAQTQQGEISQTLLPTLENHPSINVPFNKVDETLMQQESWAKDVARRAVHRYLTLEMYLKDRVDHAAYGNVPIGNLTPDAHCFLWDVKFLRALKSNGHVAWYSTLDRPDLGYHIGDAASRFLLEEWDESWVPKEVINPGFFSSWCIEFRLSHFEVASVLLSQTLMETEDPSGLTFSDTGLISHFQIFRELVASIFEDAVQHKNLTADGLLLHMCRWLRCRSAGLYDPLFSRLVNNVANRALASILLKITKVGGKIVYGRRDRILVATPKLAFRDSTSFAQYLMASLREIPVLQHVLIVLQAFWFQYLMVDANNFIGRKVEELKCDGNTVLHEFMDLDDSGEPKKAKIDFQWRMADQLPETLQKSFYLYLTQFVIATSNAKQKAFREVEGDTTMTHAARADTIKGKIFAELRRYVEDDFQPKLLRELNNITVSGGAGAVAMCKAVCTALGKVDGITHSIEIIKHNACTLVRESPFAMDTSKVSGNQEIIVRDFMCPYCNDTWDLDMEKPGLFACTNCQHVLEEESVELYLVTSLNYMLQRFYVQDLRCEKCGLCMEAQMSRQCSCSGKFHCTLTPEQVKKYSLELKKIATARGYQWLMESVVAVEGEI